MAPTAAPARAAREAVARSWSAALPVGAPVAVALGVVLVQYRAPSLAVLVLAALSVGLLAWLAQRHALAAAATGVVVVAGLPVYAGRYVGGTQVGVTPGLLVATVLLPAALASLPRARVVPMDVVVGAYCLLRVLSTALNLSARPGAALAPAAYVLGPYVVFRLLWLRPSVSRVVTVAVVAAGTASAAFAVLEHAGRGNVWFRLPSNGYQYRAFAQEQLRFGEVRAEAAFGHSIALGMFLALSLVLAVALATQTRSLAGRVVLVLSCGLLLVGALDTLSRGALLMLAVGLGLWFLMESRRLSLTTIAGLLLAGSALVVLTPVSATVSQFVSSSQGDTDEAASTQHRFDILELVRDPDQFSVLGKEGDGNGSVVDQVEVRTGLGSFDNAYALLYLANGLLTVVAFVTVGVLAFTTLGLGGLSNLERAWVAALCAAAVNLFTVNLLTQFADFFWIAAAVSATAWQRARRVRPTDAPATGTA